MGSIDSEVTTDVLIVGAGPAGLMASLYLSELGIPHRIIDAKGTRTLNGRADGFHVKTAEVWDSFDMVHKIGLHAAPYGLFAMWMQDDERGLYRQRTAPLLGADRSRQPTGCFHQGYIEAALMEAAQTRGGPRVERGTKPLSLLVEQGAEYPVKVRIRHQLKSELNDPQTGAHSIGDNGSIKPERGFIDAFGTDPEEIEQRVSGGREGTEETLRAKYVIGTDGAHSWVRHQLPDFRMEGDSTDAVWGVIDIIPYTNWPDIRKTLQVMSHHGSMVVIPRERNLVRFYVQLPDDYGQTKSTTDARVVCTDIMNTARTILAPYTLEYKYCDWWTVYKVGQRVCNHNSYLDRVFLAGDAVHTHTPKGGQGMNVSQQDSYNLAWKIAGVLRGQLDSSVLQTYSSERLPVAAELISLDKLMSQVLTAREKSSATDAKAMFARLRKQDGTFICYEPSSIVASADTCTQQAAEKLDLGMRVPDPIVYNQTNGMVTYMQSLLKSNGSWRLLVFAGDVSDVAHRKYVNSLGGRLAKLTQKYPSTSSRRPNWLEIVLFHSGDILDVESTDFDDAYFQLDPVTGRNYYTIFADTSPHGKNEEAVHSAFGVDKKKGALAVVRPDQYVAWVGNLDEIGRLEQWFATFMIEKSSQHL